jgi:tetratricopeptide (TPR) repeat protein
MSDRPLEQPRLCAIRDRLDDGDLAEAQQLLAELDEPMRNHPGAAYLAIRLLFERGKIDVEGVAERLAELIERYGSFLEAAQMLDAALSGNLTRSAGGVPTSSSGPTVVSPPPSFPQTPVPTDGTLATPSTFSTSPPTVPLIPPAPPLPNIALPPDKTPSYIPDSAPTTLRDMSRVRSSQRPLRREEPDDASTLPPRPEIVRIPTRLSSAPPGIRSGKPAVIENDVTTPLLSVITLLDDGLYAEASSLLDQIGENSAPELLLLRSRALLGARRLAEARVVAIRLASAPLLEPQLRAGIARVLIELGETEDAVAQARRAHADDPKSGLVRQTLAWALLRAGWREDWEATLEAKSLIAGLDLQPGPKRGLLLALRACAEAFTGEPVVALDLASEALQVDNANVDALVGRAIAAARLGDTRTAQSAYFQLVELDEGAGSRLASLLTQRGVDLTRKPTQHEPRKK